MIYQNTSGKPFVHPWTHQIVHREQHYQGPLGFDWEAKQYAGTSDTVGEVQAAVAEPAETQEPGKTVAEPEKTKQRPAKTAEPDKVKPVNDATAGSTTTTSSTGTK